jgi:hypothetical protein
MSHSKQKKLVFWGNRIVFNGSIADPGCFFRIPDPDFYPSPFSDPGSSKSNKRGGGENLFSSFFEATNFTDLKIILFLNRYRKKISQIY